MDFFEEMSAALVRDAAKRGIRCSGQDWAQFNSAVQPSAPPVAVAAVEKTVLQAESKPFAAAIGEGEREVSQMPAVSPAVGRELPDNLTDLQKVALNCRNCVLCQKRNNVVFGEGNPRAELMFIGEGPGADEDASGRPFVGAAGQLLDKMIAAMHLSREDVYIANIVKCRPPGNRMPAEEEAAACIGYLERQIELIRPKVIVLLGGTALHFLLKTDGITRCRGRWYEYKDIAVMPTFHPAFLLRKAESKREAWHDLKLVMAKLGIPV